MSCVDLNTSFCRAQRASKQAKPNPMSKACGLRLCCAACSSNDASVWGRMMARTCLQQLR
eukprot:4327617-Amphidinium_carterae.1